jgi:Protein of unknown function (DUF3592)
VSPLQVLWFLTLPLGAFAALVLSGYPGGFRAGLVFGALLLALGLVGDVLLLREQLALPSWRPTAARVVRSEKGEGRNEWRFEYEYESGGAVHRCGTYTKSPRFRTREDTEALIAEYPVGRAIVVHVDPRDPEQAVVYAEPRYGLPIAGLLLHGWLAAALVRALRRR